MFMPPTIGGSPDVGRYVVLFEDFLAAGASGSVADLGTTPSGETFVMDGADAGSHTATVVAAGGLGGIFNIATSGTHASVLALTSDDGTPGKQLPFDCSQGPIMQCRLKVVSNDITTNQALYIGIASEHEATADDVTKNAWIKFPASMDVVLESDDDSTDNDDKDPSLTVNKNEWYEFRVDASTPTDVKFYYRQTLGGAWTEITDSTTTFSIGASADGVQPYIRVDDSGSAVASVYVDYVAMWQERE